MMNERKLRLANALNLSLKKSEVETMSKKDLK